jgi:predicted O-methyltransferase YrrM
VRDGLMAPPTLADRAKAAALGSWRLLWGRSRIVREARAATLIARTNRDGFDLSHLATYKEQVVGPVQRDEAVLLYGLIRVLRPLTVVEIGFQEGHSAFNFLRALDREARLYSFDLNPACVEVARRRFGHDPRFQFVLKSQEWIEPEDVDGRVVDFLFLDASHDARLNQMTFARVLPMLSRSAVIAVHDTGTVPRELLPPGHYLRDIDENWIGDRYEGVPGEREFVNWLLDEHPEFAQLHLHSDRTFRHGISLIQRGGRLARSERPAADQSAPWRRLWAAQQQASEEAV